MVHESIAGGGLVNAPLPSGLLAEGRLMLLGLLDDLARLPHVRVTTTRDARVSPDGWPAGVATRVMAPGASLDAVLDGLLADADAALLVAPETDGVLERLTRRVERAGRLVLGASSAAVRVAADKGATAAALLAAGVAVPPGLSVPLAYRAVESAAARVGYPAVVKPTDGVSGLGATRVEGPAGLHAALERAAGGAGVGARAVRVERWIEGAAASVSLVADGRRAVPLALHAQRVAVGADGAVAYAGGATPLDHPRAAEALEAAQRAVEAIPGLAGYVGVDLVLRDGGDGPVVVEVNPRLTTAYAGLRLATSLNLAGLAVEACRGGRLPAGPVPLAGRAAWTTGEAWLETAAPAGESGGPTGWLASATAPQAGVPEQPSAAGAGAARGGGSEPGGVGGAVGAARPARGRAEPPRLQ